MEAATCASSLNYCRIIGPEKIATGRFRFSQRHNHQGQNLFAPWRGVTAEFKVLSCYNNTKGMMGSGKTTVGKILAEVLGYSFFDSDKLVEQAVGLTSVAQIFNQYSESFFRDNESEVLRDLSFMRPLVVATGGGAVIRPINWKYMKQGITVWLDVPLEALARRIAAVGTDSRPLLHDESGDAYTKAFKRLSVLSEERGEMYENADTQISLQHIASKLGLGDVSDLTPSAIAIEALLQIENFLKVEDEEIIERNF